MASIRMAVIVIVIVRSWSLRSLVIKVKKDFALFFPTHYIKYNFNYIYIVALKTHPRNENDQNDFDHNDHFDRHTITIFRTGQALNVTP